MALSQIPNRGSDPVALADVTLEALLTPSCRAEKGALQVARDKRKEEQDHDPLGSARGIINGLRLSITLWSFIVLIILLMW